MKSFIRAIFTFTVLACLTSTAKANNTQALGAYSLKSPDEKLALSIELTNNQDSQTQVLYSLYIDGKLTISRARAALNTQESLKLFNDSKRISATYHEKNNVIFPAVKQKSEKIIEHYNELVLTYGEHISIAFRAFNNGVAYRFITSGLDQLQVNDELVSLNFAGNYQTLYPQEKGFISHNERSYLPLKLQDINKEQLASLPLLIDTGSKKLVFTETDLQSYPGLWLTGSSQNTLQGTLPKFVLQSQLKPKSDRNEIIDSRAHYLARYQGDSANRSFPWRIFAVSRQDAELLTNQLSFILAEPVAITDTSWIKPGKVAWDWWNANNLYGVDFKAGINTETYLHYIDFAAENNIEYVILDEGWYTLGDVLDIAPDIDVRKIIDYGKEKGVGVILWVIWETLDQKLEQALATYAKWDAVGIKVDFMQRDDQTMVDYYWRVAKVAAKHKLLVNFHGSYKPAGLRRTYPNVITREGVRGLEHNKWADYITSEHNLTIPFIRMLAGPMDYTPGAITNMQPKNFHISFERPMSQTTRAHQVAMYVIYESPLQMLADSPSQYRSAPRTTEFIRKIPTVWDETQVISARLGEHIVMARRLGETWYIGAMNNANQRQLTIDLSFLKQKKYQLSILADGLNANNFASDTTHMVKGINSKQPLTITLAENGGWVGILTPNPNPKK